MKPWIVAAILGTLLIATNCLWGAVLMDQAASISDRLEGTDRECGSRRLLADLFEEKASNMTREELVVVVEALDDDEILIKPEGDVVYVNDIGFEFQEGVLVSIDFM